ncbi:MAG: Uma2 family endonuclease [Thermodesulfobacteriota bacterium]
MIAHPAKRAATYSDLLALPENLVGEIIDGELVASPRPSRIHAYAAASLDKEIGPPFHSGRGGPGGWIILMEPEIAFGPHLLVPDLAGWRTARFPPVEDHNWISVAPDWVCELLSPKTVRVDRITKLGIYAQHGVRHFWLIDPLHKTLEVFGLEAGRWLVLGVFAGNDRVRAEPFQEVEIELSALWLENRFPGPGAEPT